MKTQAPQNTAPAEATAPLLPHTPSVVEPLAAMPFLRHVAELRRRLLKSFFAWIISFLVCYPFAETFFRWLVVPLKQIHLSSGATPTLIYNAPFEVFLAFLRVTVIAAIFLSLPYIFFQLWGFIAPGLQARERRWVVPFVVLTTVCFLGGVAFCYWLVLPAAYDFFIHYAPDYLVPHLTVSNYLTTTTQLLLIFGIVFELPLLLLILVALGIIRTQQVARQWRWVIVGIFILSAVITPTLDMITMLLMAIPLVLLFALSLAAAAFIELWRAKTKP